MKQLLTRGVVAGALGGLAMALVLLLVGERSITRAIELEDARDRAAGAAPEPPLFSRTVQVVGGGVGAVLYGVFLGVVFAVVLAAVRHKLPQRTDWRRSVALAVVGFVAVVLVPALKFPANPPAVGDPDTVDRRTALYLVAVAWSIVSAWAAWRLARALRARGLDEGVRLTAVVAAWATLVVLLFALLPGNPDAVTVPATLVWRFRTASLGGQVALWATLGTTFGLLSERAARAAAAPASAPAPPAAPAPGTPPGRSTPAP